MTLRKLKTLPTGLYTHSDATDGSALVLRHQVNSGVSWWSIVKRGASSPDFSAKTVAKRWQRQRTLALLGSVRQDWRE